MEVGTPVHLDPVVHDEVSQQDYRYVTPEEEEKKRRRKRRVSAGTVQQVMIRGTWHQGVLSVGLREVAPGSRVRYLCRGVPGVLVSGR